MKKSCIIIISKKNLYSKRIIKILKTNFKTKVVWSTDFRNENLKNKIGNWKGEYLFHYSSYYKIPTQILNRALINCINFHPSTSKYPGSGGTSMALMNGDKHFGSIAHLINYKIDNGLILKEKKFRISKNDNIKTLKTKSLKNQFELFKIIISLIIDNKFNTLIEKSKLSKIKWSKRTYKIKEIDKLQTITLDLPLSKIKYINKVIKATHLNNFPVMIKINKYKFKYYDE